MDVVKLFQWDNSLKAISKLESLLKCGVCDEVANDAKRQGRCEHFFCAKCIDTLKDGTCPKCSIPSPPGEMQPDRIISSLVASAKDLRHLINGGEITSIEQGIEAPPLLSTPKNKMRSSKLSLDISSKSKGNKVPDKSLNKDESKPSLSKSSEPKGKKELNSSKVKNKAKALEKSACDSKKANNTSVDKLSSKINTIPVTPEGKKILKVSNLSALGMSPNTSAINKRNSKGETMLHIACIKGEKDKVKSLLEGGANPNSKDNAGWTPLHEACSHGFHNIAELLLQHGAIVDVPGGESDENALHDAVTQGQLEVVKLLRSWGASDTARNLFGDTPRSLASLCMGAEEIHAALDTPIDMSIKKPPVMPPFLEKMVLLGSGLTASQSKSLVQLSKMLRARVVSEFCSDVSHIVTNCMPDNIIYQKTLEYFMGLSSGKWIVSHTWMDECLSQGLALSPEAHEVRGSKDGLTSSAPKDARINASKMRPGLFSGCHIYLWGCFREPFHNKKNIEAIIKAGNGVVLAREPNPESTESRRTVPYHANPSDVLGSCSHIILYQEGSAEPQIKYNMEHIKTLPLSWFIDCIDSFTILVPPK